MYCISSCFTSVEFKEYLEYNCIKHIKIATGSPQANGQVELINRSLGPMIAKLIDPSRNRCWDTVIEDAEFSISNTILLKNIPVLCCLVKNKEGKLSTIFKNH